MASKKKRKSGQRTQSASSVKGGSMIGMRSGFKKVAGKSKKKKRKGKPSFMEVFTWLMVGASALLLVWAVR